MANTELLKRIIASWRTEKNPADDVQKAVLESILKVNKTDRRARFTDIANVPDVETVLGKLKGMGYISISGMPSGLTDCVQANYGIYDYEVFNKGLEVFQSEREILTMFVTELKHLEAEYPTSHCIPVPSMARHVKFGRRTTYYYLRALEEQFLTISEKAKFAPPVRDFRLTPLGNSLADYLASKQ